MRIVMPVAALALLGAAAVPTQPSLLGEGLRYVRTKLGIEAAEALPASGTSPLYVLFVRYAPGERSPLHTHPDARVTTVLRGTFHSGGADAVSRVYPAGSVIHIPANTPHFGWAKEGAVLLQETGSGATGTTIIDPPASAKP